MARFAEVERELYVKITVKKRIVWMLECESSQRAVLGVAEQVLPEID